MRLVVRGTRRHVWWLVAAIATALLPVSGVFTTSRLFFVRDLTWYFWPRHDWLRQTVAAGHWPWWDPYIGGGQSAVADALNQFFLLPVTALRLLAPAIVGFNLWIALPFPVAAAGAWLWLRAVVSAPAAFVGALVFALSGPMLSTGNFPNLSWSAAFIPWVLWAAQRLARRGGVRAAAVLAGVFALQGLSGEALTFAATGALTIACVLAMDAGAAADERWRRTGRVALGLLTGGMLAAVQLLPLGAAALHSPRSQRLAGELWSLHPLSLVELLHPSFFGQALYAAPEELPWIPLLNSGREPLLFSLYIGLGALSLALVRSADPDPLRRWRRFWWTTAFVSVLLALGHHTPVHAVLQAWVPVVGSFRYAVKYLLFVALAIAALAAAGVEAWRGHVTGEVPIGRPRAAAAVPLVVGAASVAIALAHLVAFDTMLAWYTRFAAGLGMKAPQDAGRWLTDPTTWLWVRLGTLGVIAGLMTVAAWQRARSARLLVVLLCGFPIVDLLAVHHDLNPTATADVVMAPPVWLRAIGSPADAAVYVGGFYALKSSGGQTFVDAPARTNVPAERPFAEAHALTGHQMMMTPAPWRVRQVISVDLPDLWPREYRALMVQFVRRSFEERIRLLVRSGVRYCILPKPPSTGARPLQSLEPYFTGYDLYECGPRAQRAYVAPAARVERDLTRQAALLFDARHDPSNTVLLDREPPAPAGRRGEGRRPEASLIRERPTEVVVRAQAGPEGGYLTLLDSFDPGWRVLVDGRAAPLLRANVLFRAVRLEPGVHEVRFTYRPVAFLAGLAVSGATLLALLLLCVRPRRLERPAAAEVQV